MPQIAFGVEVVTHMTMPLAPAHIDCHAIDLISGNVGVRNSPSFGHGGIFELLWLNA